MSVPTASALPRYVPISEVTTALSVTRAHVYSLIAKGVLPPLVKFGAAARFNEAELLASLSAIEGARS